MRRRAKRMVATRHEAQHPQLGRSQAIATVTRLMLPRFPESYEAFLARIFGQPGFAHGHTASCGSDPALVLGIDHWVCSALKVGHGYILRHSLHVRRLFGACSVRARAIASSRSKQTSAVTSSAVMRLDCSPILSSM